MKKIILLIVINFMYIVRGMDTQQSAITNDYIRNFIYLNPCFFVADKSAITAEYMYWFKQKCKMLLVQKNLVIERELSSIKEKLLAMSKQLLTKKSQKYEKKLLRQKETLESQLFIIHGPYENKNILNPYFFNNQSRFPYVFKKKNTTIGEDIEEIKACINSKQELILAKSPKVNENK